MKNLSEIVDNEDIITKKYLDDKGYMQGMTILSYGNSTWQDFINAYSSNKVVYCRASSNSNPASGSQTRLAFMAYVSNETTPTNVEFQYYRSVSTHTASQQGDQVYVYKLTNAGAWSVTVREASVKVAAGGDLTGSYSNGTFTVSGTIPTTASDVGAATSSHTHGTINNDGSVTSTVGDWDSGDAIAVIDATNNQIKKGPIKQNSSSVFLNGLGNWATPSDEKLSVSPVSDTNTYYPILSATSSAGTATRYVNSSFGFGSTSSTAGISIGSSSQDAILQMYANGKVVAIKGNTSTSANREITLPNAGGTVALTSDIPDVSGKIDTAGTGLSKSGTTLNHSNSVTATTTQAVYSIKIDAQGHISEHSLPVVIPDTDELFGIVNYSNSTFEDVVEAYDIYGEKILLRTNVTSSGITHIRYPRLAVVEKDANGDVTQFTFSLSEKGNDGNHPYDIEYNHRFIIDETNGWSYDFKQLSTASNLRNSGLYEVLMLLDTSSDLYTDIVALGWNSDVITT